MTGMTIAEFLRARIAEDEDEARRASIYADAWTEAHDTWQHVQADGHNVLSGAESVLPHVSRWDPARVLAECAAKRAIIAEHGLSPYVDDEGRDSTYCSLCHETGDLNHVTPACPTVRALAAIYATHPDCQQAWRV